MIEFLHSSRLSQSCGEQLQLGVVLQESSCSAGQLPKILPSLGLFYTGGDHELLTLKMSIAGRTNPRADKNNQLANSWLRISY